MQEEKRPLDPTRRLLRVFGVKVTDYEERTTAILDQARAGADAATLAALTAEVMTLTADLNDRLREMSAHVLETEARVLRDLNGAMGRPAPKA